MMVTCMAAPFTLAAAAAISLRRWTLEPCDEDVLPPHGDVLDRVTRRHHDPSPRTYKTLADRV
jgi:hypothetical protein